MFIPSCKGSREYTASSEIPAGKSDLHEWWNDRATVFGKAARRIVFR